MGGFTFNSRQRKKSKKETAARNWKYVREGAAGFSRPEKVLTRGNLGR